MIALIGILTGSMVFLLFAPRRVRRGDAGRRLAEMYSLDTARTLSELKPESLEYKLLVAMLKQAGKVLTHRYLLREVWGPQDSQEHHYLRVYVASLRRKLEDDPARPRYLLTEQGVGYRFASE